MMIDKTFFTGLQIKYMKAAVEHLQRLLKRFPVMYRKANTQDALMMIQRQYISESPPCELPSPCVHNHVHAHQPQEDASNQDKYSLAPTVESHQKALQDVGVPVGPSLVMRKEGKNEKNKEAPSSSDPTSGTIAAMVRRVQEPGPQPGDTGIFVHGRMYGSVFSTLVSVF